MRLLSAIKTAVVPDEAKPRTIKYGAFQGIKLDLSLKHRSQVYLGLYERETHSWLKKFSKGIKTGIDIGAAEGELALFFLQLTKAEKVLAFEPSPECLAVFWRNLAINGIDPRTTDRLIINESLVGSSNSDTTVTLDSLAGSIQTPCFIKMDVDGAEEDILLGAKELNRLPGVRWLIETHSELLEKSCLDLLTKAGFQSKVIKNAWWRIILPEVRPIAHNRWLAAWKAE